MLYRKNMATTCSPLCKDLVFKTFASSLEVSGYNGKFIIADNFHAIVVICCCYGGFEAVVELFLSMFCAWRYFLPIKQKYMAKVFV